MGNNIYVAVDLGNSEIRMMAAARNEDGLLDILGVEKNPTSEGAIMHGIIKNPSDVSYSITELAKKLSNRLDKCPEVTGFYTAFNGRTLCTTQGKLEKNFLDKTEITEQRLRAFEDEFKSKNVADRVMYDIRTDGYMLDDDFVCNPIGVLCRHIESNYLITYGLPDIRQNMDAVKERLSNIEVCDVKLAPIAIADAIATDEDRKNGCAVLNFGAATTSVVVYEGGCLRHMAVVPFGGQHVTNDLCYFKFGPNEAERVKVEYGVLDLPEEMKRKMIHLQNEKEDRKVTMLEVTKAINARLKEIVHISMSEIGRSGYKDKLRNGLIVSGGGARFAGFVDFMKKETGMPVRFGSYGEHLSESSRMKYNETDYALMVGLLMNATVQCVKEGREAAETQEKPVKKKRHNFGGKLLDFFSGNEGSIVDE